MKKVVIALMVQIAISKIVFSGLVKGQTERTILLAKLSGRTIYLTSKLLSNAHTVEIYSFGNVGKQLSFFPFINFFFEIVPIQNFVVIHLCDSFI